MWKLWRVKHVRDANMQTLNSPPGHFLRCLSTQIQLNYAPKLTKPPSALLLLRTNIISRHLKLEKRKVFSFRTVRTKKSAKEKWNSWELIRELREKRSACFSISKVQRFNEKRLILKTFLPFLYCWSCRTRKKATHEGRGEMLNIFNNIGRPRGGFF